MLSYVTHIVYNLHIHTANMQFSRVLIVALNEESFYFECFKFPAFSLSNNDQLLGICLHSNIKRMGFNF